MQRETAIGYIQKVLPTRWQVRVFGETATFCNSEAEARAYFNRNPRSQVSPENRFPQKGQSGRIVYRAGKPTYTDVFLVLDVVT